MIMSDLSSLEGATAGNKWHVHQFPTSASGGMDSTGCGGSVTGGHYDPTFKVGYSSCSGSDCEVGDLSGKFGRLGIGASTEHVDCGSFDRDPQG